jgi:hypothetical protein
MNKQGLIDKFLVESVKVGDSVEFMGLVDKEKIILAIQLK